MGNANQHGSFTLERRYSAPPAKVFAAFAKPKRGAGGWSTPMAGQSMTTGQPNRPSQAPSSSATSARPAMLGLFVRAHGDVVGQHRGIIRDDQVVLLIGPRLARHWARLLTSRPFVIESQRTSGP